MDFLSVISSLLSICCRPSYSREDDPNRLEAITDHCCSSSSTTTTTTMLNDGWSYDVFLSFRGEDTRKNFTDHLYDALDRAGIRTFRDYDKLERGKAIGPSLLKAIEGSRISIVVFSINFASSKWCLNEIVKMVECMDRIGQTILPIFLDVDPSDVKNQTGNFKEAFDWHEKHIKKTEVNKWRAALREIGRLSGWNLKEVADGHESKLISIVIKEVLSKLNRIVFDVAKHPVGIDSRVEEVTRYLQVESNDVLFVGIWGLGGIGKTTIAKAVFNKISSGFQCVCFLSDIREAASLPKGLVTLQKQLLGDILKEGNENINDVSRGKVIIKERLRSKKILLILDDVDHNEQLDALAGEPNWFGSGSRIIVTSRDEHVLKVHQSCLIYKPEELNFDQSLQLFSNHAFCRDQPPSNYRELSKNAASVIGGLPLALEVFGSFLFQKEAIEWKSALCKLKNIPLREVQERLKLSYDGLDNFEREIFLDIACFLIGTDKKTALYFWDSCEFHPIIGLRVLVDKSLVKIGDNDELKMHDHIRDMGREIVRQENYEEPIKRSRLWKHKEVMELLRQPMGSVNIKGLHVEFGDKGDGSEGIKAFAPMLNLRYLHINHPPFNGVPGLHIIGGMKHLPRGLRWLSWKQCCLTFLPSHLEELVFLDLSCSRVISSRNICNLSHEIKMPGKKLKVLDLSKCGWLNRASDLSGLVCLERLILNECRSLVEIDESIGNVKKLVFLDLRNCSELTELPSSICELKSLKTLLLTWCSSLCKLPANLGAMESLTELNVDGTGINQLPDSIGDLKNLTRLSLWRCTSLREIPDSIWKIKSLIELNLAETMIKEIPNFCTSQNKIEVLNISCCKSLRGFPESIGNLRNLKELHIEGTCRTELPASAGSLEKLEKLNASGPLEKLEELSVCGCKSLRGLLESIGNLRNLKVLDIRYTCITELPASVGSLEKLERLSASNCKYLVKLPDSMRKMTSLKYLHIEGTGVVKLPEDFGLLSSLKELKMAGCEGFMGFLPVSFSSLRSLEVLRAGNCNLIEDGIPNDFGRLTSLTTLELQNNKFCRLPASISALSRLEFLDLSYRENLHSFPGPLPSSLTHLRALSCKSIERLPDLSNLNRLKELIIFGCEQLAEIQGLSNLKILKKLNIGECKKLAMIQGLEDLEALEQLFLNGCISIDLSTLKTLRNLKLICFDELDMIQDRNGLELLRCLQIGRCTSIKRLPDLSKFKSLMTLKLGNWEKLVEIQASEGLESLEDWEMRECTIVERLPDLSKFKSLKKLKLENCEKLAEIQACEGMESLEDLRVKGCTLIERLPDLSKFKSLKELELGNCDKLSEIQGLEGLETLELLQMWDCQSIEKLADLSNLKKLKKLEIISCHKLMEIQGLEYLESLEELHLGGCNSSLANSLMNGLVPGFLEHSSMLSFPGSKIPYCFTPLKLLYDGEGESKLYSELSLGRTLSNSEQQLQHNKNKIIGLMLCIVIENQEGEDLDVWLGVDVKRNGKLIFSTEFLVRLWLPHIHQEEDQFYFFHFKEEDEDAQEEEDEEEDEDAQEEEDEDTQEEENAQEEEYEGEDEDAQEEEDEDAQEEEYDPHRFVSVLKQGDEVSFRMKLRVKEGGIHVVPYK